jgi:site-specific recombinase XerD
MDEIALSELIEQTKDSIRSLEHSQVTVDRYQMAWRALADYFIEHNQVMFSKQLAEQYILESKAKLDAGAITRWRYKLNRQTVLMLIEYFECGHIIWKRHENHPAHLHQLAFILLHQDYLDFLKKEGKSAGTIRTRGRISRQFLEYLEQRKVRDITEVQGNEISSFIPVISKQHQATGMGAVLSSLRSFLRFVESKNLTQFRLSNVVPSSSGSRTKIVPTITTEEERKLLESVDNTTVSGKRNYAILLLALRAGLRCSDIVNLKLGDIRWKSNTIEVMQAKTDAPLILPLLTDVGNAIADYILNGRPDSQQPYIFLRTQAPYRKLAGYSACYAICCKIMKKAGIRQGKGDRKGFHCLRHSLAAHLLAEGIPLPIISNILGHRDKDSTKVYLSTDLVHLRACGLSLAGIEVTKEELL